jgi:hypothetical protein
VDQVTDGRQAAPDDKVGGSIKGTVSQSGDEPIPSVERSGNRIEPRLGDAWSNIPYPGGGPRFPLAKSTREVFNNYYRSQLERDQAAFLAHFRGSDLERATTEARLRSGLPRIVGLDAWQEALNVVANQVIVVPLLLTVVAAFMTPQMLGEQSIWFTFLITIAGLLGGVLLWALAAGLETLIEPKTLGAAGILTMLALSAGAMAWLYEVRPTGWMVLGTAILAFSFLLSILFVIELIRIVATTLLNRRKLAIDASSELSEKVIGAIIVASSQPLNSLAIASSLNSIADFLERNWRHLFVAEPLSVATQQRVRQVVLRIVSGIRQTSLEACFPVGGTPLGAVAAESVLVDRVVGIANAILNRSYGDLPTAEPVEIATKSRLRTILHGVGSGVAAFAPVALLVGLPWALDFTVNSDLNGTLLTVSLAWLALYVVRWLDPEALNNVSSVTGMTDIVRPGRRAN